MYWYLTDNSTLYEEVRLFKSYTHSSFQFTIEEPSDYLILKMDQMCEVISTLDIWILKSSFMGGNFAQGLIVVKTQPKYRRDGNIFGWCPQPLMCDFTNL